MQKKRKQILVNMEEEKERQVCPRPRVVLLEWLGGPPFEKGDNGGCTGENL